MPSSGGVRTIGKARLKQIKALWAGSREQRLVSKPTSGPDLIKGGQRSKRFNLGGDDDLFYGGDANDSVQGGSGDDTMIGRGGTDVLIGGAGDDRLEGRSGRSRLTGGSGSDLFILSSGNHTITDFNPAEGDQFLIQSRENAKVRSRKKDVILSWETGRLILKNIEKNVVSSYQDRTQINHTNGASNNSDLIDITAEEKWPDSNSYEVRMSSGNDTFKGGSGDDYVWAGSKWVDVEDSLDGGGGADTLLGEEGSDSIRGGKGNDYLNVDSYTSFNEGCHKTDNTRNPSETCHDGDDTLDGGPGNDFLSLLITKEGYENKRVAATGNPTFYLSEGFDVVDGFTDRSEFKFPEGWDIKEFESEPLSPDQFGLLFSNIYPSYPFGEGTRTSPETINFPTYMWSFEYNGKEHQTLIIPLDGDSAEDVNNAVPFPYNIKQPEGNYNGSTCRPDLEEEPNYSEIILEDSHDELNVKCSTTVDNRLDFGPGEDVLNNTCALVVSGDGIIDMGDDRDELYTNTSILAELIDGGSGSDRLYLNGEFNCDDNSGALTDVKSMRIKSFEQIQIDSGSWELRGDFSDSTIALKGGTLAVPIDSQKKFGLRAKRNNGIKYSNDSLAEIAVTIDVSGVNDPTQGRWRVLSGVTESTFNAMQDALSLTVTGTDQDFDEQWSVKGSRLFVSLGVDA